MCCNAAISASGHKRTLKRVHATSALPPKADIGCRSGCISRLDSANGESTCLEVYGAVRRAGQCGLKVISQAGTPVIRKTHAIAWRRALSAEERRPVVIKILEHGRHIDCLHFCPL